MNDNPVTKPDRVVATARKTRVFLVIVAVLGIIQLAASGLSWHSFENREFLLYFFAAGVASLFPLKHVGNGISLSVPFVLMSIVQLSIPEAVAVGCISVLIQFLRSAETRGNWYRIAVGVGIQALVISTAKYALNSLLPESWDSLSVRILVATTSLFVAATLPVVIAVRLNERQRIGKIWRESYAWAFPFYIVSGAVAIVVQRASAAATLEDGLLGLMSIFLAHRYYRNRKTALANEREYSAQMAALHIRAIEALALSVEAKDNLNTKGHLRRVQVHSLAIGRELGLDNAGLEALHAGALLHDIGKLAVPDHILTKPGKLTPEEFAKMKVHPLVGAEIVEQMRFPYPVAPIVREHHEKWNGSGYPFGLKGEQISLGARIISLVDCFDALTSDREYRKGIPVGKALEYIVEESGKSFDPKVVEVAQRLFPALRESLDAGEGATLSINAEIRNGLAPDAGLDLCGSAGNVTGAPSFLSAIAAARREDSLLWKVASSVVVIDTREVLSRIHQILQGIVPFDSMAILVRDADALRVEFSTGLHSDALAYLEIPMGDGLAGWVAQRRQPVVNGNPSVDPGFPRYAADDLRSALAIPLEGRQEVIGVLTLYRAGKDAFAADDLRILKATTPVLALALENALKYTKAQERANIDIVTGLPKADSFHQTVAEELARSRRKKESLCVLFVEIRGLDGIAQKQGEARRDDLLAVVASSMKGCCREYDRIARIGAASFALALPWMKVCHLRAILDRIELLATGTSSNGSISFTFGGAFYPEDGDGSRNLLAVAQRRAQSMNPSWTENIRALADFADQHVDIPSEESAKRRI